MEKTMEQKEKISLEVQKDQNKILHSIFTMTKLQAKIVLTMIMYGADLEYSIAVALKLNPKN